MDINKAKDAYREDILRQLVVENHNREMQALFAADDVEMLPRLSNSFEQRMKNLIARGKRKKAYGSMYSVTKRVVVILLFVVTALFAMVMTIPDIRAAIQKTIVEWFDEFTAFRFDGGAGESSDLELLHWYPQYIPDGYTETQIVDFHSSIKTVFEDSEQHRLIFQSMRLAGSAHSLAIDNEHSDFFVTTDNDIDYNVFSTNDSEYPSHIIWEKSGYAFYISGYSPYEELLDMAISASVIE